MAGPAFLDGERIFSLATGRGGAPSVGEWPFVVLLLTVFALVIGRLLLSFGLTRVEAGLAAIAAPLLVLIEMPLGTMHPGVALSANVAGAVIPFVICIKVLAQGRAPAGALLTLIAISTIVSYASSEVVPSRGVLLHYRIPAFTVGVLAAVLWYRHGTAAGAGAYAAGAAGVILGADLVRLGELASAGSASRIIIGGAGLFDGIYLVAFLSAGVAASVSVLLNWVVAMRAPRRTPA